MYTAQPKKLLILQILDILRKHSDENHRLSQKGIADLLEKEYGVTVERKAVKRNLMDLIEYGYPIEYDETKRSTANRATGEMDDTSKLSGFYLAHDFSEGELRLLIDGVLSSRQLPHQQSQALIKKLEDKGYIEKSKDPADGRALSIELTQAGKALQDQALCVPECMAKEFRITPEEANTLYRILYKILETEKEKES